MPLFGFHLIELPILLLSVFWLWMLMDCLFNKSLRGTQKAFWLIIILCTHLIGAIIYFFVGRPKKNVGYQQSQGASAQQYQPDQPYSQGYQAQQTYSSQSGVPPASPAEPIYEQYDQPRATYPELPQQETR